MSGEKIFKSLLDHVRASRPALFLVAGALLLPLAFPAAAADNKTLIDARAGTGASSAIQVHTSSDDATLAFQAVYTAGATVTLESQVPPGTEWEPAVQTWSGTKEVITAPVIGPMLYRVNVTGNPDTVAFTGSGLDDLTAAGTYSGTPGTYTVTIDGNPVAATGTITCVAKADLVDGETVTINDGTNAATVFEFDVAADGVTGGRTAVDVSTDTTAAEVAARLRAAINGVVGGLTVTASAPAGAVLTITNDAAGTNGNETITETVANAGFVVTGMAGGTDTDTFKWRKNSGTWTEHVAITTTAQTLSNGRTVTLAADTGHTVAESWLLTQNPVTVTVCVSGKAEVEILP